MKKQTVKYSDENIGKSKIIKDFLPKPEDLVLQDQTIKVTLSLSKSSINFLNCKLKNIIFNIKKMIRMLLDQYTAHYEKSRSA